MLCVASIGMTRAEVVGGECGAEGDNVTWSLDTETGVLTISGTGEMDDYDHNYNNSSPWSAYRDSITELKISNGITIIGRETFNGLIGLTEVIISNSVKEIKGSSSYVYPVADYRFVDGAFSDCVNLQRVVLPESLTGLSGFDGCTSLTSIDIPNSVVEIGEYAFSGCTGLTSIEIPNSVTRIGSSAFSVCTNLTSIEIPNSVTSIDYYAFSGCTGLASIEIPNSVTRIGQYTFSGCTGLTSIELPNSVTYIESCAFEDCTGLTSVELPNSVTRIDDYAFSGCTGLTSIEIPSSVTEIGDYAFSGCTGLTSIEIPSSVTEIGDYAFPCIVNVSPDNPNYASINGILFDKEMTEIINCGYNIRHIVIPEIFTGVLSRDEFSSCDSIEEMTINTKVFPSIQSSAGFASLFKCVSTEGSFRYGYTKTYQLPASFKKLTLNIDSLNLGVFAKEIDYSLMSTDYTTIYTSTIDTVIIKARKLVGDRTYARTLREAFPAATYIEVVCTGTEIPDGIFTDNGNIKKFEAPNAITVGTGQISGLSGLEELSLPKAQSIAPEALSGLVSLKSLTLPFPGAGTTLSVSNFGELFGTDSHDQMRPVTQVMMDGEQETYYLPSGLDSLTILEGCGELPYGCFYGCTMLKQVVLPSSLYSVGEKAFYGCAGMTDIWCRGADPAVAYDNSFDGMRLTSCKLHVPYDTSEMYARAAGWERFYYIEEEAPLKISVVKNIENAGVIYGLNEYQYGDPAELRAVANSGYTFSGWTEGGTLLTTESTLSFIVEASRSLTALFAPVSGDNEVEASPSGGSVTFTWDAEEGADSYVLDVYTDEAMTELVGTTTFDSDGNVVTRTRAESRKLAATIGGLEAATEYFWQMTVLGDAGVVLSQYTGEFVTTASGLDSIAGGTIGCHGGYGVIVVSGAEGRRVTVFDTAGTVLWSSVMASDREALPSAPGLRIVDIDGSTFKVVVR